MKAPTLAGFLLGVRDLVLIVGALTIPLWAVIQLYLLATN